MNKLNKLMPSFKMLNIDASFIKHVVQICSNICSICQQTSECPMQRTMLAAVHATEERLITPRYMIQISALLAFCYTKCELFASKALVVIYSYWMHLRVNLICIYFLVHKNTITACCLSWEDFSGNVAKFYVYK